MPISVGNGQARELLNTGIAEAEKLLKDTRGVDEVLMQLEGYLKEVPVVGETLSEIPLVASLIKSYITREYDQVSPKVIACLLGSILYLVKKNDLISDKLAFIGMADDIAVLKFALTLCQPELQEYSQWRAQRSAGGTILPEGDSAVCCEALPEGDSAVCCEAPPVSEEDAGVSEFTEDDTFME